MEEVTIDSVWFIAVIVVEVFDIVVMFVDFVHDVMFVDNVNVVEVGDIVVGMFVDFVNVVVVFGLFVVVLVVVIDPSTVVGLVFEVVDGFVEDIDDLVVVAIIKVVDGLVGIEGLGMTSSTSGFPPLPFSKTRDE